MTTVWPSRRLRFGRSRRTRRGSDDGMEKAPPTVRRWGRVPPPRAGLRVPWFPSGVPRAAEHGNGRHHAKGRRTDPTQGERCRPFPVPMPGVEPGAVLPKVVKGDFQGAGRSGAQGKGVADRTRPHWIRPATPFWFPWCAGRGSRGVPPPGVEPGAVTKEKTKTVPVGAWARPGRERIWARPWARAADRGGGPPRARGQVRRITSGNPWCRPGPSPRVGGTRSADPRRRPRRAQPARPRRCSRRSRRAARGRHHPTTGRTGWHRR